MRVIVVKWWEASRFRMDLDSGVNRIKKNFFLEYKRKERVKDDSNDSLSQIKLLRQTRLIWEWIWVGKRALCFWTWQVECLLHVSHGYVEQVWEEYGDAERFNVSVRLRDSDLWRSQRIGIWRKDKRTRVSLSTSKSRGLRRSGHGCDQLG